MLRVLAMIDVRQLEIALMSWGARFLRAVGPTESHLAVDGQSLRRGGSGVDGETPVHGLSAVDVHTSYVVARRQTDEKSNEITAVPQMLQLLNLTDTLVSIDAMGCQLEIAALVRNKKGDYLFGLKNNQPTLFAQTQIAMEEALSSTKRPLDAATPLRVTRMLAGPVRNTGHGRIEEREAFVIHRASQLDAFDRWVPHAARFEGIESIVMIKARRTNRKTGVVSEECRFYISSRTWSAEAANVAVRDHWTVENKQHYVVDVTFGADQCRVHTENAATNFACLRNVALLLLRRHKGDNASLAKRRHLASLFPHYLEFILSAA